MAKGKGKKSGGSGGTMLATVASTGTMFLMRKLLGMAWTKVTGKEPPTDLSDRKVTLPEALGWAVLLGIIGELARFAVVRATTRRPLPEAGDAESG
ncbi:MAG TPA: DUF4235 domain-containing protein [Trebonia sp.]|jgi:hypothetical protein|nr:DUF4235 domain-containing protein [Trebonia sp.]